MNLRLTTYLSLFILLFSSTDVMAQNIVTLERFESAKVTTEGGEQTRKLYNAQLKLGNVTMVCDSAWQFINRNELRAFGNIQIDTETENIWADTLFYYTDEELSLLRGRVIIQQDSTTLFGTKVDYNFLSKVAYFREGIRLEDNQGILTAKTGTYFQNQDSAVFRMQVQLTDSSQYVEGDSLFINRKEKELKLFSNVFVIDSLNKATLTGDYLEADSTGRRYVYGNSLIRRIETDSLKSDTTFIQGSELLLIENDSVSTVSGYDSVSVWTNKFSSLSDSLEYNSNSEQFDLKGSPKAWHKNIQLSGPFISVKLDSNEVKELNAFTGAFAVQKDSVTGRLNQLKGDTLNAYFETGDLSEIQLFPNSTILYHTTNDAGEPDGAMESNSPQTILYFENGELVRAKMGKNEGFFLPEYEELSERKLKGFVYTPDLKPEKPKPELSPRFSPVPITPPFALPRRFIAFLQEKNLQRDY